MEYHELTSIMESYPPAEKPSVLKLAKEQERRNEQEILELAAIASDLQVDSFVSRLLNPEFSPLLSKAFSLAMPSVDPKTLSGLTERTLEGFIGVVKGKYFEVLVVDRLNAGEAVGGLKLAGGQLARLAESPNQPAWDIEVVAGNGKVVEQLQLKATRLYGPVFNALYRHPDIRVLVPEPLAGFGSRVIHADIPHSQLLGAAKAYVGELGKSERVQFLEDAAQFVVKGIPLTSILIVGGSEGVRLLMGRASLQEAMSSGGVRLGRQAAYNVVGNVLLAAGLGPAAIPTTMALSIAEARISGHIRLSTSLGMRTEELNSLSGPH